MRFFFLFSLCLLSFTQKNFAQCTNPEPIGSNTQTFCKSENKTVADLIPNGSNIVWYDEASGGIPHNNSATLVSGNYYADDESNSNCSVSRLHVEVFVYGNKPDTFLSVTECAIDNPTISDLYADGDNIEWFDAEFGGNLLPPSFLLNDGDRYWAQQTENGCVSKRSSTKVTLLNPAPPAVNHTSQTFCKIDKPTISDIDVQLSNPNNSAIWYKTETSVTPLDPTEILVNGSTYWGAQIEDDFSCESTARASVTIIINQTPKPTISASSSSNQSFCIDVNASVEDLEITGTDVKWYDTLTSTTALSFSEILVDGEDYYATQTNTTTNCESLERTVINVTVTTTSAPTTTSITQTFCEINNATIADLDVTGTDIKWYDTLTSTTALNVTEALIDGEDYYATQTGAGCESANRIKIEVNISAVSAPTSNSLNQIFCLSNQPTLANLEVTGTNIT